MCVLHAQHLQTYTVRRLAAVQLSLHTNAQKHSSRIFTRTSFTDTSRAPKASPSSVEELPSSVLASSSGTNGGPGLWDCGSRSTTVPDYCTGSFYAGAKNYWIQMVHRRVYVTVAKGFHAGTSEVSGMSTLDSMFRFQRARLGLVPLYPKSQVIPFERTGSRSAAAWLHHTQLWVYGFGNAGETYCPGNLLEDDAKCSGFSNSDFIVRCRRLRGRLAFLFSARDQDQGLSNIGALIITIGFWGTLYYRHNKAPPPKKKKKKK